MEGDRRVLGEEHAETVLQIGRMGSFLLAQGRLVEAEKYLRESMEEGRRLWGGEDREMLQTTIELGRSLAEQGKFSESQSYLRAALEASHRALGEEDSTTLTAIVDMGDLLQDEGKLNEAEALCREALEKSRRAPGSDQSDTLSAQAHLGALFVVQNRFAEAEKLLAPVEAADRTTLSGRSATFGIALMSLGMARSRLAEFAAAETDLLEAQPILARMGGPKGKLTRKCTQALIDLYKAWNVAQPDKGHDATSAEWKRKLDAMDVPVPTATAH
jgi:non-specific serine/threonine protein kinase/serine/threonine-protein kinase